MSFIRKPVPLAVSLALSTLCAHAVAQGTASSATSETQLMTVVVVGSQPMDADLNSVTLDAETLQAMRAATSDTATLLRDVPGLSFYGAGGVSSLPSIRGLADDRLRIKVDGMDLIAACPNHMNSPLSYIDPTAVATATVYAGISPVSAGGDSIGGSILVESAAPEFALQGQGSLLKGEAGAFYRSNGNAMGGNLAATVASEQASLSYTASYAQADNYKAGDDFKDYAFTGRLGHTLPLDEVGSTAYEAINQALKFAWKNDGDLFEFKYGRQHIPYEAYPNQRMDMTDNVSDQFNLAYTSQQAWGTLKARAYYEHTQHEMDFGDDKRYWYGGASGGSAATDGVPCSPISGGMAGCAAGMPMYTDGKNTGLNLHAEIPLAGRDVLRVGGEVQAYRLDDWWTPSGAGMWPYTFLNINDGQRDRYAVFGEWEGRINRQWTGLVGVRHETVKSDAGQVHGYNLDTFPTSGAGGPGNQTTDAVAFNTADRSRTDHNWDLSALARYVPEATQTYEIGVAQKTRSPNLYERYTWSTWQMAALMNNFVGDGNGYVGNLNLEPEVAHTLSLAADWHDAGNETWSVKLAPYYTHVKDYIDAVRLPGQTGTTNFVLLQYANQSARLYGVDLSVHALVARGTDYGDFTARGVVSYTRGENRDTGDNLYNIMPLNARLALTQKIGAWRNTVEGELVARKSDVSGVRNEMETPGYGLVHLRGRYEQKRYSIDFGIENLFDRFYALPLGGAYVGQGTTMANPALPNYPQWGTPVPGPGRSVYAGLNVQF
ncbi:MAG: TonB-dependent receptor plug domain-containing protein [Thiobacillus sp.]|nr:TonB-dependent receptor plug domain-containing protein [Thiobacillus sp.]